MFVLFICSLYEEEIAFLMINTHFYKYSDKYNTRGIIARQLDI